MKKVILSSLIATTLFTTIAPTTVALASENDSSGSVTLAEEQVTILNEELKNKVNPYIHIENDKFILSEDGAALLSSDEIEIINNYLLESNQMVAEAITSDNELIQQGNQFTQTADTQSSGSEIMLMSSTSKGGITLKYTWWGLQIQFSHKAVTELSSYLELSGAVGGASNTIKKFLAKKGLTVAAKWLGRASCRERV